MIYKAIKNNKGSSYFSSTAFMALILSFTYIFILINPLINSTSSIKDVFLSLDYYIDDRNGLERLHSKLFSNISFSGDIDYPDIEKLYKVRDLEVNKRLVTLNNVYSFHIDNETSIEIDINSSSIDEEQSYYYNLEILLNNKVVHSYSNLKSSTSITIPASYTYNRDMDSTNYGEYEISISSYNAYISTKIEYEELDMRKIIVSSDGDEDRFIVLENDTSVGGIKQIYFLKGGN